MISEIGAGGYIQGMELDTVGGEGVERLVRQLVTGGQVQLLDVGAVLGETDQG